jgi:hypothetical protein
MGAGLLAKSFLRLMNVDPGFDSKNELTLFTYVYSQRYGEPAQELGYYQQVFEKLRSTPGIDSVGMVSTLPLTSFDRTLFHIQDKPLANPIQAPRRAGMKIAVSATTVSNTAAPAEVVRSVGRTS